MEHLTMTKIMKFISFNELNAENMRLASEVNLHMIECPLCREKVHSIQETLEKMYDFVPGPIDDLSGVSIDGEVQKAISDFYKN